MADRDQHNSSPVGSTEKTHTHHAETAGSDDIRQVLKVEGTTAKVLHADGTVDYVDTAALGGDYDAMPKGYFKSPQFIGTVIAQCFGSIIAYLGWVLPANTLMLINNDLGPSADIGWSATIWTMGSSIGFLLVGRLSDLFGRKWMVISTSLLSLIGCILGATAKNVTMLIVANGCNGIGAAGQLSFNIVLGELVPNKLRGPIITVAFMASMPFAVFGPVIARTLIENTGPGWRISYYMGIGLNVISLAIYYFLYHPPTFQQLHVGKTYLQQAKELDWIGIFLWIAGCVLFIIGLSWGGTTYPWESAEVLCTLLIGVATVAGFFVYESYFCRVQPLMPPRMFRNKSFDGVVIVATVGSMVYYSMTVLWPTIIGSVYTTDVLQIGWDSCVVGGGVLLGQILAGFALSYVPKVKYQTIIASAILLTFATALSTLDASSYARTIAFGVVATTAVGYVENITFPGVTLVWGPQDIGLAVGVLGSIRGMGGAVAQALYMSVYTNQLQKNLPEYVGSAATGAGLPAGSLPALFGGLTTGDFSAVDGINDSIIGAVTSAVKEANVKAFQVVFYTTIPFSVILLAGAFLVPNFEKFLTKDVAKRLQDKEFAQADHHESKDGSVA